MRHPVLSFTAGELTPLVDARSDVDKYRSGCRVLENMLPRIYGPAERRPGTKYIETCDGIARAIPFIYSNTIAYIVLLEDDVMYFYYNGSRVLDGVSARLSVVTPYDETDLFELQYKQSNDVMWIVHGDYQPRKLTRTTATAFSLDTVTFIGGPFKKRNDLAVSDGVTITPSVTTGSGTLTLSAASGLSFDAGHVGGLFSITQPRVNTITSGTSTGSTTGVIGSAILVEGAFSMNTSGTWIGTLALQRSIDGTLWENFRSWTSNNDRNVQYTGTEPEENVQYRINVTSHTSGTINADLTVNSSTQTGYCRVTSYTSTTVVAMTVVKDFASVDADVRWAEGCWSDYRGWPKTVTFFENRTVYASTSHQPQTVWFSATDDFEKFTVGTNDADSFSLTMSSDTRCAIQWIASSEALLLGTSSGEWRVRSSSFDAPITPSNFSMKQQTTYGSKSMQSLVVNEETLFVDFVGRKVRAASYDGNKDKYLATDRTALAEHITVGGIIDWDVQTNPDSIIWAVTGNGVLLTMSYEIEQNVIAWARHPLRGSDLTKSVATIPSSSEDEIWIVTYRYLNGSWTYCLEQMQPRSVTAQDNEWFVDCGIEYDSTPSKTITGLGHLESEDVKVLGDGAKFVNNTVASANIALANTASHVIVGLPFRYKLKLMRFDLTHFGTTKGSVKRFAEAVVSLYNTLNVQYGVDEDNLFEIDFRTEEVYGSPPSLYTGDIVLAHEGGYDAEDSIIFTGDGPLPCVIRCIVPRIETVGR
ncbi:MAG: hypothetical protein GY941_21620 [Planctomycetes bacterium]|nr:hypothetical protein [Planctomycetota bacterium]